MVDFGTLAVFRFLNAKLSADLAANGSALAKVLDYDGTNWVDTTEEITVWDFVGRSATSGSFGYAIDREVPGRWEFLRGGDGAIKIGILDGALAYHSSATASIYSGTPNSETDSTENVTAYCWLLKAGESLAAGTRVMLAQVGGSWYVMAAACPATSSS